MCGGAATVVAGFKGLTRLSGLDMRIARVDDEMPSSRPGRGNMNSRLSFTSS